MKRTIPTLLVLLFATTVSFAQGAPAKSAGPYAVEYYYKVKWGHSKKFLTLFKKNHYPVLQKGLESGRMLKCQLTARRVHRGRENSAAELSPTTLQEL